MLYDIISVAFIVGFFAVCVAYVSACEWILGPDESEAAEAPQGEPSEPTDEAVAA